MLIEKLLKEPWLKDYNLAWRNKRNGIKELVWEERETRK